MNVSIQSRIHREADLDLVPLDPDRVSRNIDDCGES